MAVELSEFSDLHHFLTREMGLIPEPEHGGTWRTYFFKKVIWHPSQTTRTLKVLLDQLRIPVKIQLCVSSDNNNSVFVPAPFESCTLTRLIKNELVQLEALQARRGAP